MGASRQSFAEREVLRIGSEISAALPQFMSQSEVGRRLGISQRTVSYIERKALYKLRMRLLELRENSSPE